MDDEWDACLRCGCEDFEANEQEWERVCRACGTTSAYELSHEQGRTVPYFYKHESYFQNSIIGKALLKGAPIGHIVDQVMCMFHKSLRLFFDVRHKLQRNNYPSYSYVLWRLCLYLGVDIKAFITLPRMTKTVKQVEVDFAFIDPCIND